MSTIFNGFEEFNGYRVTTGQRVSIPTNNRSTQALRKLVLKKFIPEHQAGAKQGYTEKWKGFIDKWNSIWNSKVPETYTAFLNTYSTNNLIVGSDDVNCIFKTSGKCLPSSMAIFVHNKDQDLSWDSIVAVAVVDIWTEAALKDYYESNPLPADEDPHPPHMTISFAGNIVRGNGFMKGVCEIATINGLEVRTSPSMGMDGLITYYKTKLGFGDFKDGTLDEANQIYTAPLLLLKQDGSAKKKAEDVPKQKAEAQKKNKAQSTIFDGFNEFEGYDVTIGGRVTLPENTKSKQALRSLVLQKFVPVAESATWEGFIAQWNLIWNSEVPVTYPDFLKTYSTTDLLVGSDDINCIFNTRVTCTPSSVAVFVHHKDRVLSWDSIVAVAVVDIWTEAALKDYYRSNPLLDGQEPDPPHVTLSFAGNTIKGGRFVKRVSEIAIRNRLEVRTSPSMGIQGLIAYFKTTLGFNDFKDGELDTATMEYTAPLLRLTLDGSARKQAEDQAAAARKKAAADKKARAETALKNAAAAKKKANDESDHESNRAGSTWEQDAIGVVNIFNNMPDNKRKRKRRSKSGKRPKNGFTGWLVI